jgi:hypothetical protein
VAENGERMLTTLLVTLVTRPLLTPVAQKLCWCEHVHSQAERVLILRHYFASKSFAAVCETFSNACPDKKVPTGNDISRVPRVSEETMHNGIRIF